MANQFRQTKDGKQNKNIIYRAAAPLVLTAAGTNGATAQITQDMHFLTILSATNVNAVQISFDGATFNSFPNGFTLTDFDAADVYIRNTSSSTNTVVMAIGLATLRDNRFASAVGAAITIADGADVAEGATTDAAATNSTSAWSVIALLKGILALLGVGGTATTNVISSFTSTVDAVLLAGNAARKGATVYNQGGGTLYLSLGTTAASLTSYTVQIVPGAYYEVPFKYTGAIHGIMSAAGTARVSELG